MQAGNISFLLCCQTHIFCSFLSEVRFLLYNLELIFVSVYFRCTTCLNATINHMKREYFWRETLFLLTTRADEVPELLTWNNILQWYSLAMIAMS